MCHLLAYSCIFYKYADLQYQQEIKTEDFNFITPYLKVGAEGESGEGFFQQRRTCVWGGGSVSVYIYTPRCQKAQF